MFGCKRLIELTRLMTSDATPGDTTNDTDVNDLLNAAMWEVFALLGNRTQAKFIRSKDITYVSGTELYRWGSFANRIAGLERTDTSQREPRFPVAWNQRHNWLASATTVERIYQQDTQLGIVPVPSATGTLRVWSYGQPAPLHWGTASAVAAGSITLVATPDVGRLVAENDFYNEMPIFIESATAGAGQTNIITDFVASTLVATLGFTWPTTPTGTVVYSLMPPLPPAFHILLVHMVSELALGLKQDVGSNASGRQADRMMQSLLETLGMDDEATEQIKMTGWD